MTATLPPILAAMLAAHNAHDTTAFLDCFADDAVVRDEGRVHFGKAAIRAWFDEVVHRYSPVFEVSDLALQDGEPVLHGRVAGKFDGSPLPLRYFAAIEDEKLVALKIAP
jgi:hypothetical protein